MGQFNDIFEQLESWYGSERGAYLHQATRAALAEYLDTAFGYHILQLGQLRLPSLIDDSRINHRIFAGPRAGEGVGLVCDADELPLESDSVDVIVAHHCLEFSANPHAVLRELQRVLTPQGQLLLVGFNPLSLHGAGAGLRRLSRHSPWRAQQAVAERRLADWLRLLGCEPTGARFLYALPPFGSGRVRELLVRGDRWLCRHNLPLGGLYIIHAVKQVGAYRRPQLLLRKRSERLVGLVPKPGAAASPAPGVSVGRQARNRRVTLREVR